MSQREDTPWDRFTIEWNAEMWNLGLDIVSTVILKDESTDRVAAVSFLANRFVFVSFYDEEDILEHNLSFDEFTGWPTTSQFFDEDEALDAATEWIDKGILPHHTACYTWYLLFI
jgi:peptide methionine sulfoxide reductase MsrB